MNDQDLERMEEDLDAVAGRLAVGLDWGRLEPRVRWALGRPLRELLATLGLVAACVVLGVWTPVGWMLAAGLLLAAVPGRVNEVRERRRVLDGLVEGDLFALVQSELRRDLAHHFVHALSACALALVFALFGVFLAADPKTALIPAVVLAALAALRLLWFFPRASRALSAYEGARRTA